jgi:hypothetical protein
MAPAGNTTPVQPPRKRAAVTAIVSVRRCDTQGSEASCDGTKPAALTGGVPGIQSTMGGYCRVITLQAGGQQGPSYGLGPGEAKGDRSRARQLALAARAQGADVSDVHPFPGGTAPPPSKEAEAARKRKLEMLRRKPVAGLALTGETLPSFAKVVSLTAGGPQAMSFGIGPGEHKGERPHSREMYRRLAAASSSAQ